MYLLDDYDFLENLVKKGQADEHEPFYKDGLCLADKGINPNTIYVFRFESNCIMAVYGYTKHKNKAFYKFHKEVEKFIFSFNLPVYRIGKNQDYKNHTKFVGFLDNHKLYEFERSC